MTLPGIGDLVVLALACWGLRALARRKRRWQRWDVWVVPGVTGAEGLRHYSAAARRRVHGSRPSAAP